MGRPRGVACKRASLARCSGSSPASDFLGSRGLAHAMRGGRRPRTHVANKVHGAPRQLDHRARKRLRVPSSATDTAQPYSVDTDQPSTSSRHCSKVASPSSTSAALTVSGGRNRIVSRAPGRGGGRGIVGRAQQAKRQGEAGRIGEPHAGSCGMQMQNRLLRHAAPLAPLRGPAVPTTGNASPRPPPPRLQLSPTKPRGSAGLLTRAHEQHAAPGGGVRDVGSRVRPRRQRGGAVGAAAAQLCSHHQAPAAHIGDWVLLHSLVWGESGGGEHARPGGILAAAAGQLQGTLAGQSSLSLSLLPKPSRSTCARRSSPCVSWLPRSAAFASSPSSSITSMVAAAAAQPRALPPYVPPCAAAGGWVAGMHGRAVRCGRCCRC